jgi:hypothetical protein
MRNRRLHVVAAIAIALLAWRPDPAAAEVRIKSLDVSPSPGGAAASRFEPGTRTVYATYRYEGAVNHRIALVLTARGGLQVFESAKRYTGDGSDTVAIDGTSVTRALATELAEAARQADVNAGHAATQAFGVQEYLQMVKQDLVHADAAMELLDKAPLGAVNTGRLQATRTAAVEVADLVDRALALPPADIDKKRDLAVAMDPALADMVANADQLDSSVSRLTDLPIPTTGIRAQNAYTLQARVTDLGYLSDSVEFLVAAMPTVMLPWLGRSTNPGR